MRRPVMKKKSFVLTALAASLLLAAAGAGAAERAAGARVDVDRGGVHVDAGANMQTGTPAVRVKDMIGVKVYNPANENLGKIEDLVMDPATGRVRYAVLSFGGFLGMGDKLFAVPWADLKLVPKGTTSAGTVKEDYYVLDVSKESLKIAPGFDKNNWPNFADGNWSINIDKFYTGQRGSATRR
jgi:sporulation protein YlmC with PRC-barrel domain